MGQSLLAARSITDSPSYLSSQPKAEASLSLGRGLYAPSPKWFWRVGDLEPASFLSPLKPQKQREPYIPITPRQRLRSFVTSSFGPQHFVGGVFSSALGTALDRPEEYGPHWGGFADRFGMRLTGVIPQNAMEAGLGFVMGEDPRYFSARGVPFKNRLANVIKLTFAARRVDGSYGPAYARFAAISGSNFLSNAWRADSEANLHGTLSRTAGGLAGRMVSNAFEEFWPSVRDHFFPKG